MLVNGCNIIMYKYQDRKNLELVDISSYKALLESKVSFTDNIALEPYSFEEIMSYEFTGEGLLKYMLDVKHQKLLNLLH